MTLWNPVGPFKRLDPGPFQSPHWILLTAWAQALGDSMSPNGAGPVERPTGPQPHGTNNAAKRATPPSLQEPSHPMRDASTVSLTGDNSPPHATLAVLGRTVCVATLLHARNATAHAEPTFTPSAQPCQRRARPGTIAAAAIRPAQTIMSARWRNTWQRTVRSCLASTDHTTR